MAKVAVRYIGSNDAALLSNTPSIPSIQFNRYGQLVEMDEEVFKGIISGKYGNTIGLLLDSDFASAGHTPAELTQFANPSSHADAPQTFLDKRDRVHQMFVKIRDEACGKALSDTHSKEE